MVDVDGQKGGGKCQVTIQLYCRLSVASVISQSVVAAAVS